MGRENQISTTQAGLYNSGCDIVELLKTFAEGHAPELVSNPAWISSRWITSILSYGADFMLRYQATHDLRAAFMQTAAEVGMDSIINRTITSALGTVGVGALPATFAYLTLNGLIENADVLRRGVDVAKQTIQPVSSSSSSLAAWQNTRMSESLGMAEVITDTLNGLKNIKESIRETVADFFKADTSVAKQIDAALSDSKKLTELTQVQNPAQALIAAGFLEQFKKLNLDAEQQSALLMLGAERFSDFFTINRAKQRIELLPNKSFPSASWFTGSNSIQSKAELQQFMQNVVAKMNPKKIIAAQKALLETLSDNASEKVARIGTQRNKELSDLWRQAKAQQDKSARTKIEVDAKALQEQMKKEQLIFDTAKQGVQLARNVAGICLFFMKDGEEKRDLTLVVDKVSKGANAIIDITSTICRWGAIATLSGPLAPFTLLSGSISNLFGIFSGDEEALRVLSRQIQALRKEAQEVRKEMHLRFDRMEQIVKIGFDDIKDQLAEIDKKLVDGFLRLEGQNNNIFALSKQILTEIRSLQEKVDQTHYAVLKQDFKKAKNYLRDAASDKRKTNLDDHLLEIVRWSTEGSQESVVASGDNLISLWNNPFRCIDKIKATAVRFDTHHRLHFPSGPLSNPVEWLEGVAAYINAVKQSPSLQTPEALNDIEKLKQEGEAIQKFAKQMQSQKANEVILQGFLKQLAEQQTELRAIVSRRLNEEFKDLRQTITDWTNLVMAYKMDYQANIYFRDTPASILPAERYIELELAKVLYVARLGSGFHNGMWCRELGPTAYENIQDAIEEIIKDYPWIKAENKNDGTRSYHVYSSEKPSGFYLDKPQIYDFLNSQFDRIKEAAEPRSQYFDRAKLKQSPLKLFSVKVDRSISNLPEGGYFSNFEFVDSDINSTPEKSFAYNFKIFCRLLGTLEEIEAKYLGTEMDVSYPFSVATIEKTLSISIDLFLQNTSISGLAKNFSNRFYNRTDQQGLNKLKELEQLLAKLQPYFDSLKKLKARAADGKNNGILIYADVINNDLRRWNAYSNVKLKVYPVEADNLALEALVNLYDRTSHRIVLLRNLLETLPKVFQKTQLQVSEMANFFDLSIRQCSQRIDFRNRLKPDTEYTKQLESIKRILAQFSAAISLSYPVQANTDFELRSGLHNLRFLFASDSSPEQTFNLTQRTMRQDFVFYQVPSSTTNATSDYICNRAWQLKPLQHPLFVSEDLTHTFLDLLDTRSRLNFVVAYTKLRNGEITKEVINELISNGLFGIPIAGARNRTQQLLADLDAQVVKKIKAQLIQDYENWSNSSSESRHRPSKGFDWPSSKFKIFMGEEALVDIFVKTLTTRSDERFIPGYYVRATQIDQLTEKNAANRALVAMLQLLKRGVEDQKDTLMNVYNAIEKLVQRHAITKEVFDFLIDFYSDVINQISDRVIERSSVSAPTTALDIKLATTACRLFSIFGCMHQPEYIDPLIITCNQIGYFGYIESSRIPHKRPVPPEVKTAANEASKKLIKTAYGLKKTLATYHLSPSSVELLATLDNADISIIEAIQEDSVERTNSEQVLALKAKQFERYDTALRQFFLPSYPELKAFQQRPGFDAYSSELKEGYKDNKEIEIKHLYEIGDKLDELEYLLSDIMPSSMTRVMFAHRYLAKQEQHQGYPVVAMLLADLDKLKTMIENRHIASNQGNAALISMHSGVLTRQRHSSPQPKEQQPLLRDADDDKKSHSNTCWEQVSAGIKKCCNVM